MQLNFGFHDLSWPLLPPSCIIPASKLVKLVIQEVLALPLFLHFQNDLSVFGLNFTVFSYHNVVFFAQLIAARNNEYIWNMKYFIFLSKILQFSHLTYKCMYLFDKTKNKRKRKRKKPNRCISMVGKFRNISYTAVFHFSCC